MLKPTQNNAQFLSKGEERNLLPNAVRLKISGGGWTSPLLYSWGSLKKYGARLMCASNEPTPTRISKFASSLRNSALPLGEGQTKSGGHSPLLHSGCPLQPNMLRSVIPQQFRCIPEGVGALRVDTVHFYTLDTRENPTGLFLRHPATEKNASSGHCYLAGSQMKTGAG